MKDDRRDEHGFATSSPPRGFTDCPLSDPGARQVVAIAMGQPRFTTVVMTFFAGVAFFLAGLGLYGILACRVEQRVREIGVRMALGADSRETFRLIIGGGLGLAALEILIGVPAAVAVTRLLGGLLSGVTTTDPLTYGAVIALLTLSALLASYLPARRATRVDPISALRGDRKRQDQLRKNPVSC